ncbi:MAG: hypothetical protein AAF390_05955 [Pseudomonadota bacterium]
MTFTIRAALAVMTPGALPAAAQDLTIATTFGPTAEVPDPRADYNGRMSNQMGVTETLVGIDHDLTLFPAWPKGSNRRAPPRGT